jgi:hypothetical protein
MDSYSDDLRELGDFGAALEEMRQQAPSLIRGEHIGKYTGDRWIWATVQNKRHKKEIPEDAFAHSGRIVMIHRDKFFRWVG